MGYHRVLAVVEGNLMFTVQVILLLSQIAIVFLHVEFLAAVDLKHIVERLVALPRYGARLSFVNVRVKFLAQVG